MVVILVSHCGRISTNSFHWVRGLLTVGGQSKDDEGEDGLDAAKWDGEAKSHGEGHRSMSSSQRVEM